MPSDNWTPRSTRCREPDGTWMTYQGWWRNDGSWTKYAFRAPHSTRGRHYHRPPVRGGRWKIRRVPSSVRKDDRPWRAWTDGKAKKHNKSFATHAEAYEWANFVAETYRQHDDQTAIQIIAAKNKYPGKGQDIEPPLPEEPQQYRVNWQGSWLDQVSQF